MSLCRKPLRQVLSPRQCPFGRIWPLSNVFIVTGAGLINKRVHKLLVYRAKLFRSIALKALTCLQKFSNSPQPSLFDKVLGVDEDLYQNTNL